MKKGIVMMILLFLIIALVLFLFIFFISKADENLPNASDIEKSENLGNEEIIGNTGTDGEDGAGGINGESSGGDLEESDSENENGGFPSDIETVECGFYFSEYAICAGICPEGTCVSEGRSCYCRKI